jgi:hypothetical protein
MQPIKQHLPQQRRRYVVLDARILFIASAGRVQGKKNKHLA